MRRKLQFSPSSPIWDKATCLWTPGQKDSRMCGTKYGCSTQFIPTLLPDILFICFIIKSNLPCCSPVMSFYLSVPAVQVQTMTDWCMMIYCLINYLLLPGGWWQSSYFQFLSQMSILRSDLMLRTESQLSLWKLETQFYSHHWSGPEWRRTTPPLRSFVITLESIIKVHPGTSGICQMLLELGLRKFPLCSPRDDRLFAQKTVIIIWALLKVRQPHCSSPSSERSQRRFAPLYNSQISTLKQRAGRLDRKWFSSKIEGYHLAWENSLIAYKKWPPIRQNCLLFFSNWRKQEEPQVSFQLWSQADQESQWSLMFRSREDIMRVFAIKIVTIGEKKKNNL